MRTNRDKRKYPPLQNRVAFCCICYETALYAEMGDPFCSRHQMAAERIDQRRWNRRPATIIRLKKLFAEGKV